MTKKINKTTPITDNQSDNKLNIYKFKRARFALVWNVFASFIFLMATYTNFIDRNHNKIIYIVDFVILVYFLWQSQSTYENYKKLKEVVNLNTNDKTKPTSAT